AALLPRRRRQPFLARHLPAGWDRLAIVGAHRIMFALRAHCTVFALRAHRTVFALRAHCTVFALRAHRTVFALRAHRRSSAPVGARISLAASSTASKIFV